MNKPLLPPVLLINYKFNMKTNKSKIREPRNKSLKIDFLSFTFDITGKPSRKKFHLRIKALKDECNNQTSPFSIDDTANTINSIKYAMKYQSGQKQNYIMQYFETCLLDIKTKTGDFTVKLSYNPIDDRKRFLRVEFNPAKAGANGVATVCNLLVKLIGYKRASLIYSEAKITRVDITLDRYGLKHNYYAHVDRMATSKRYKTEASVNAKDVKDTQVLGTPKGKLLLTIYDKNAEQFLKKVRGTPDNTLRFEFRIRNLDYPMADLLTATNPFNSLHLYSIKAMKDELFSSKFRRRVKRFGVPLALGKIADYPTRRKYTNRLKKYERRIINAKSAWEQWPAAVEVLDPFKGANG